MAYGLQITGLEVLARNLLALAARVPEAAGAALYREGERIMTASKQIVPVDTGALRASGMVSPPDVSGTAVEVTLGFGGPAVSYAVPVHERTWVHHPNGQAKYLEQPINEARSGFESRIAADLGRTVTP